jgi:predicted amidohydrolase YtcJ
MKHLSLLTSVAAVATLTMAGWAQAQTARGTADLIVTNAHIITVDAADTVAQSLAVQGNRILAVGSDAEVMALRGPGTEVMDVGGRTVLPGFIDGHTHVEGMALVETFSLNIQAPPLAGPEEIVRVLVERARTLPAGTWIWGQGTFNQVMPTREQIDAALPDHPVRLDWSVHEHLINHRAAQILGLDASAPEPGGMGRYDRAPNGEVKVITDAPVAWPFRYSLEGRGLEDGVQMIMRDFFLKKGVTTVYDHASPAGATAYQFLRDRDALPVRVQMTPMITRESQDGILFSGARSGLGDDRLRYGALKFLIDGVWGSTAFVHAPHWDGAANSFVPDNHGGTDWTQEALSRMIGRAYAQGWRIQTHANGDRAQDMVLEAYEGAQAATPRADPRFRIEHFGHFLTQHDPARTERRLQRMLDLGVIPSVQVDFLWRLTDRAVQEPDVQFFALRRMIDLGMHPSGGVDTVGTMNFATAPFFSISRAVNRKTKYGTVVQPEQTISVMEGIRMFTRWAAEAGDVEDRQGSLEVGKLADLIVLDRDPLTIPHAELESIQIDLVVLDGQVVHRR